LWGKEIYHISGGQKQRACIARALMQDPLVLLADEPTSNLDRETALTVVKLLKELSAERELVVLYCTHDVALVESYADKLVKIRNGKIV